MCIRDRPPNDSYKAEGALSLVNLKKGTTDFQAGEWLGYQGSNMIATLDLGKELEVSTVSVSALEATGSYIFFPKQINISVSKNGVKFQKVAEKLIPITTKPERSLIKNFALPFENQIARFIKVEVKSNLVNPSWPPAPEAPCWIFVDEILVE